MKNDVYFELIPYYMNLNGPYGTSSYYSVNKIDYVQTVASIERAKFVFELSSKLVQSVQGSILVSVPSSRRRLDTSSNSSDGNTKDLMPADYNVLFVLSQIGGLMYLLKCVTSPFIDYFNSKIFKHELVNSWIKLRQLRSLRVDYSVSSLALY